MIESYADLLVARLKEVADGVKVVDMSHWFEWAVSYLEWFPLGPQTAFFADE